MVESGVGALWWTNSHRREVKVVNRMSGDRRGNWRLLPLLVRLADQEPSNDKSKTDDPKPQDLCVSGLKGEYKKEALKYLSCRNVSKAMYCR